MLFIIELGKIRGFFFMFSRVGKLAPHAMSFATSEEECDKNSQEIWKLKNVAVTVLLCLAG